MSKINKEIFGSFIFSLMLILTSACSIIKSSEASGILLQADKVVDFSDDIAGGPKNGWSTPDSGGTWSVSDQTFLKFRYESKFENSLRLKITLLSFVNPKNPKVDLVLKANGEEIDKITFNEKSPGGDYLVLIPAEILSKSPGKILLSFQITNAAIPKDLGISEDIRKLGIFLIKIIPTAN